MKRRMKRARSVHWRWHSDTFHCLVRRTRGDRFRFTPFQITNTLDSTFGIRHFLSSYKYDGSNANCSNNKTNVISGYAQKRYHYIILNKQVRMATSIQ